MHRRIFNIKDILEQISPEANRTVLFADEYVMTSLWSLEPGEEIFPHQHPRSDDVWVVLKGVGEYWMEKDVPPCKLQEGVVALAPARHVHGVRNTGKETLVFISVAAPQPVDIEAAEGLDLDKEAEKKK